MKRELRDLKDQNEGVLEKVRRYEMIMEEEEEEKDRNQESTLGRREMKEELGVIRKQMEEMQKKMDEVDWKWKRMEENLKEEITKRVVEIIEEKEDKERRMKNIVIYNLKEPLTGNLSEKEKEERDQAGCMDIFTNELQVEQVHIVETVRLGKKEQVERGEEYRPRALMVKLADVNTKWEIVKKAKRLKDARKQEYKRVFIAPDLTQQERMRDKELREQLKAKRETGEQGWYIHRGQLKRRNFQ